MYHRNFPSSSALTCRQRRTSWGGGSPFTASGPNKPIRIACPIGGGLSLTMATGPIAYQRLFASLVRFCTLSDVYCVCTRSSRFFHLPGLFISTRYPPRLRHSDEYSGGASDSQIPCIYSSSVPLGAPASMSCPNYCLKATQR